MHYVCIKMNQINVIHCKVLLRPTKLMEKVILSMSSAFSSFHEWYSKKFETGVAAIQEKEGKCLKKPYSRC